MISVKQAIVVEGKYDKIKLSSFLDAMIFSTDGFHVLKDKEKCELLKSLAKSVGLILLTDSDRAGRQIRNYLKSVITEGEIIDIYIPEIFGKEARKPKPSKEGMLGVEGMPEETLKATFEKYGIFHKKEIKKLELTKADLMADGIIGIDGSLSRRRRLLQIMNMPQNLSSNSLLKVLNTIYSKEEYKAFIKIIYAEEKGES